MKKAIRYVRVSTDDQAQGYSLSDQKDLIERWAAARGVEIVATFSDDESARTRTRNGLALLGESFDQRPGWQRLITWVKANPRKATLLLFKDYSRFSRDATDALVTIRKLEAMGIECQAVEQPIDWSIPEQVPLVMLYIGMPDAENRRRSLNTKRGTHRARKEGRWLYRAPVGYIKKYDENGKPYITPCPQIGPLVTKAFDLMAAGRLSIAEVRRQIRRPNRRMLLSKDKFGQMLRNRVYIGEVSYINDDGETEWVKGKHDGIVSKATFDAVQFAIGESKDGRYKKDVFVDDLPLRGHILDPTTLKRLSGSGSKSRHGYRVWYYHGIGKGAYRIRADKAHGAFKELLRQIQPSPEVARLIKAYVQEDISSERERLGASQSELKRQLTEVEQRLMRTDEMFIEGKIQYDSYTRLKDKYTKEQAGLTDEIQKSATLADIDSSRVQWTLDLLSNLGAAWEGAPVEGKHALVGSILPAGIYLEDETFRTPTPSPVVALLSPQTAGKRTIKRDTRSSVARVSRDVPFGVPMSNPLNILIELESLSRIAPMMGTWA